MPDYPVKAGFTGHDNGASQAWKTEGIAHAESIASVEGHLDITHLRYPAMMRAMVFVYHIR
jgi:hypothetical protein